MTSTTIAIVIFVAAYALIISEKVHRTIVGIFGAMLMILFGIISQETAIHHIDFNTLGLLMGMMIIVNITSETGLFNFLAIWAAKKVKARPVALLVALSAITAVCSALLDNVTTVLLTVPITFSITSQLKVDVKPYLMAQIISSNIGGTATLIGDPPNIMIGSAVGLSFMDFIQNMTLVSVVIFIVVQGVLVALYGSKLKTTPELQDKVMRLNAKSQIADKALLKKCLGVIFFTITLFTLHGALGLETATAALTGAGLLLLLTYTRNEAMIAKVLSKVEWTAIFFFAGLFVLVGALVDVLGDERGAALPVEGAKERIDRPRYIFAVSVRRIGNALVELRKDAAPPRRRVVLVSVDRNVSYDRRAVRAKILRTLRRYRVPELQIRVVDALAGVFGISRYSRGDRQKESAVFSFALVDRALVSSEKQRGDLVVGEELCV